MRPCSWPQMTRPTSTARPSSSTAASPAPTPSAPAGRVRAGSRELAEGRLHPAPISHREEALDELHALGVGADQQAWRPRLDGPDNIGRRLARRLAEERLQALLPLLRILQHLRP